MAQEKPEPKAARVTPEVYNAFLKGIELRRVRLVSAKVEARVNRPSPTSTEIRPEYQPSFENEDKGFEALARYELEFVERKTEEVQAILEPTFGLFFTSSEPMREEIFEIFGELNLKVNSWPYAREYVQANLGRMDWPGFALPLLKPSLRTQSKQGKAPKKEK